MFGFSSFGGSTFAGLGSTGAVIIVSGRGVTVSSGTVSVLIDATVAVTGNAVTVSSGTVTFKITADVDVTGSGLTISTGAADVNVITWNVIDTGVTMTWTNLDPL